MRDRRVRRSQQAAPLLLEGLGRLEHRGYDSAGVAVLGPGKESRLRVAKKAGRVRDLADHLPKRFAGKVGIGHTRWATHGPANDVNAHPHVDTKGDVAVVHNGIIDNAAALRAGLADAGVDLVSDTDTEVLAHLIGRSEADTLEGKVAEALARVEGTYGLAVVHAAFPDRIVVARNGSPLIIGIGDHEMFVASDLAALVRYTTRVAHLDDGELATITAEGFTTYRQDLSQVARTATEVEVDPAAYDAGEHDVVHAQGDARAARGRRAGAARPARRAVRHLAPRRSRHGRARPAGDPPGQGARLRLGVLRRADGRRTGRGAGPDPGRRRVGQRVPLPQPDHRAGHALRRGQPVRGDHRHPARGPGDPAQGRSGRGPGERRRARRSPASATAASTCTPAPRSRSPRPRR